MYLKKELTIHEDMEQIIQEATSVYASLGDGKIEKRYRVKVPTPEVLKVELNNQLLVTKQGIGFSCNLVA